MQKENKKKELYNSSDLLKQARISYRQLYHWEAKGLLNPDRIQLGSREFKRYSKKDLYTAKLIRDLLDEGYALPNIKMLELIIKRKKIEDELIFRLKIEEALYRVSDNFVNPVDLDESVRKSLLLLAKVIHVNRVYVFEFIDDHKIMRNTYEVCIKADPQIDNLQNLSTGKAQWWMNKLRKSEEIIIEDVRKIDDEAVKEILSEQMIKSLLAVPMFLGEKLFGFMGFDDTEKIRQWNKEDIIILKTAADILSRGINHNRNK